MDMVYEPVVLCINLIMIFFTDSVHDMVSVCLSVCPSVCLSLSVCLSTHRHTYTGAQLDCNGIHLPPR